MKIKFLLGVTLISVALVGCGQSSSMENTSQVTQKVDVDVAIQNVSLNLNTLPDTLDPQFNHEGEGTLVINHLYEGLMRQVGDEFVNGIAQSYTVSEDGLIYTFNLRDGQWSDGTEITASDFEYAWRRGADPLTGGSHLGDYEAAKIKNAGAIARGEMSSASLGVLALDTKVLEVSLEEPNEAFLDYMTLESFMPLREEIVDGAEKWDRENVISNGPFKLAAFNEQGITLERNENYWNAKNVNLQRVDMKVVGEASAAESKYLENELDILISNINCTDAKNIVLTPPVITAEEGNEEVIEEVVEEAIEEGKQSDKQQLDEEINTPSAEEQPEDTQIVEDEQINAASQGGLLVHSWIGGWRTNLQGLLWLGNAYVEEHQ
nr:ABC transporter substrate-binding protein [uncultured Cellulosilyticum sp.]